MEFYGYYVVESEGRGLAVGNGYSRKMMFTRSLKEAVTFRTKELAEKWAIIFDVPDYKVREVNLSDSPAIL